MMFADADLSHLKKSLIIKAFKKGGQEMAMEVAFVEEENLGAYVFEDVDPAQEV